ncbi:MULTISPECIES: phage head-tail joining protein [unclassified Endozoicomonas]|uniref:phage head-tail joining protein n=1 Tax=unclassified Endozoicomonas TaxID=2644528 RepID=UPI0021488801|nr:MULTISPECIES: hypothetical protein [unclassified Endozoicomonas]
MITEAEYQALKRAVLLRETRTVEFEGRKVEYASFSEMEGRLQAIEWELIKRADLPALPNSGARSRLLSLTGGGLF